MLIEDGAVELVVPGILPMGCFTSYITTAPLFDKNDVNMTTSCLNRYNEFAQYHNEYLQRELQHLRKKHSHARIIYADYYGDSMRLFESPKQYGEFPFILISWSMVNRHIDRGFILLLA